MRASTRAGIRLGDYTAGLGKLWSRSESCGAVLHHPTESGVAQPQSCMTAASGCQVVACMTRDCSSVVSTVHIDSARSGAAARAKHQERTAAGHVRAIIFPLRCSHRIGLPVSKCARLEDQRLQLQLQGYSSTAKRARTNRSYVATRRAAELAPQWVAWHSGRRFANLQRRPASCSELPPPSLL